MHPCIPDATPSIPRSAALAIPAAPPALALVFSPILALFVDFPAILTALIALHLVRMRINRTIVTGSHPRTVIDDYTVSVPGEPVEASAPSPGRERRAQGDPG